MHILKIYYYINIYKLNISAYTDFTLNNYKKLPKNLNYLYNKR